MNYLIGVLLLCYFQVINSYCNHMQTHHPRADRHIVSSWVSHWLILRGDGKVKNSKKHFMEHFTNQSKMVSRVTEEYFVKDKVLNFTIFFYTT